MDGELDFLTFTYVDVYNPAQINDFNVGLITLQCGDCIVNQSIAGCHESNRHETLEAGSTAGTARKIKRVPFPGARQINASQPT